MRRKQAKQKSKDRLRSEKEKAAAEREAKQKADLEEAQKAATASKARDELERCSADPTLINVMLYAASDDYREQKIRPWILHDYHEIF